MAWNLLKAFIISIFIYAIPILFMSFAGRTVLAVLISIIATALIFRVVYEELTKKKIYINIQNQTVQLTAIITSTIASGISIGNDFPSKIGYTSVSLFFANYVLVCVAIAAFVDCSHKEVDNDKFSIFQRIFWRRLAAFSGYLVLNVALMSIAALIYHRCK